MRVDLSLDFIPARAAVILPLARLMLVSAFLLSGLFKFWDFSGAVAEVRGLTGIDNAAPLAVLTILVQLGGSLLVLRGGVGARWGALLLAGFTVVATVLAHAFWTRTGIDATRDFNVFFEHLGLIGGFLLVAATSDARKGSP